MAFIVAQLEEYARRYADPAHHVGFRMVARLVDDSSLLGAQPPALDGQLAALIVAEALAGDGLEPSADAYSIPLPLTCLWRSADGLPLWAASQWRPAPSPGMKAQSDVAVLHKRAPEGVNAQKGRWQERQMFHQTHPGALWEATGIGDVAEIARLFQGVRYMGKKRSVGYGEIVSLRIRPYRFSVAERGALVRAVPSTAMAVLGVDARGPAEMTGWTPPAWLPSTWLPGYRAGSAATMCHEPRYRVSGHAIQRYRSKLKPDWRAVFTDAAIVEEINEHITHAVHREPGHDGRVVLHTSTRIGTPLRLVVELDPPAVVTVL